MNKCKKESVKQKTTRKKFQLKLKSINQTNLSPTTMNKTVKNNCIIESIFYNEVPKNIKKKVNKIHAYLDFMLNYNC